MKKCLFFMLMMVSVCAMGQEKHKVYCQLLGHGKWMSTKVNVTVDFGQETNFWRKYLDHYLVDENGNKIKFNSMVDAMNYMGRLGWEFEQAYVVTVGNQNVYHWLLSKEVDKDEQIDQSITTKQTFKNKLEVQEKSKPTEDEKSQKPEKSSKKRERKIMDEVYM